MVARPRRPRHWLWLKIDFDQAFFATREYILPPVWKYRAGVTASRISLAVEMKGGPQQKRGRLPASERRIVIARQFGWGCLTFVLGLFGAVERQDRNGLDLGGSNLNVGTIGLKLAVPQFAPGFDEGTLFKRSGPFSELPPDNDPMPLSSSLVFAGVLIFPTHVGCERKPGVGCPVGRKASLGVFTQKADERDAILAKHFVSPFCAPSVGATGSEWVLLPRARDALLGETFRGNRQSRVTWSRRAQSFDPQAEPNRRGPESGLDLAATEARAALHALRNSTAEKNDLTEALERAAESALGMSSMKFAISVEGDVRQFHPIVRDEIYRIGCEAIRNASLHSEANQLSIAIAYGKEFLLRISDDGKGMSPEVIDHGRDGYYGLKGMLERATRIKGTLRFESRPGAGTEVVLNVPGNIAFSSGPSTASDAAEG